MSPVLYALRHTAWAAGERKKSSHTSALLARIPLGVALWEATDDHLAWSNSLWLLLQESMVWGARSPGRSWRENVPNLSRSSTMSWPGALAA